MRNDPPGYRTKTEVAVDSIRALLLQGELTSQGGLTYRRLSELLGMSQTPIREAVRRLEAEGMLRSEPHKGIVVTGFADLSLEEVQDLYLVRMLLEREAARLAARNITSEQARELSSSREAMESEAGTGAPARLRQLHVQWHSNLHRASGSPYLATLCTAAWNRLPWEAVWVVPGRLERAMAQHAEIERAVLQGDADAAAMLMEEHVESGREAVLQHWRSDELTRRS